MNPTEEQKAFADHDGEAFVEACPGAGKTRTIVNRLAHLACQLPPRKGVAILSFTNKAIEEFKSKACDEGVGHLLHHPGYIGTFDAFLRMFLFSAPETLSRDSSPQVIDSWERLGIEIRLSGKNAFRGPGVSLDCFDSSTNAVNLDRIGNNNALLRHVDANRALYERAASFTRKNLNGVGIFSASDAREIALRRIRDEDLSPTLGRAIAGRFHEIVVDEAQDCNPLDLEILRWLRMQGISVTVVCDLDQSIYSFRDGGRNHIEQFAESYDANDRLTLTGNFRCSPPICALAASLRSRTAPDVTLGATRVIEHPIALFQYRGRTVPSQIGQWFESFATSEGRRISRSDVIVLAHSRRVARMAAGGPADSKIGGSKIECLASAISEFWDGSTNHSKDVPLSSIEGLLLDVTCQREGSEPARTAVKRLHLDGRSLRRQALELVVSLPRDCPNTDAGRDAWIENVRRMMHSLGLAPPDGRSLKSILRKPGTPEWSRHLEHANEGRTLKYSTIHEAKGGEYEGGCVVVPPDDTRALTTELFEAWDNRIESESKRVLYVGVTRAKQLVGLAIPEAFIDRCRSILTRSGVSFELFA